MRSVALALLVVCIAVTAAAAVPRLIMPSDDGGEAVLLSAAAVRVTIRGHLARTEYELTFRNRLPRVVGGDFVFPLPPDAEVSDLGLYFDGKLRHAVAVERALAKSAYEETVHRRVDPALAEWSDSRAFRMRLYPIPANGEKKVFIACDQELVANDYVLDLRFKQKLASFSLAVDSDVQPVVADGLTLSAGKARLTDAVVDATVTVHRDENDVALTAWSERERAWVVSAPLHVAGSERPFESATHVTLLWDASGSAVQQNGARLRAFLDRFLRRQTAWTTVTVIPFHLWVDEARETTPRDLARTLDSIDLAGATNLVALLERLPEIAAHTPASRLLLVSDGINSMGDARRLAAATGALAAMRRPLTIVNASPHANEPLLRELAATTGGRYLDLTMTSSADAAERAMLRPARIELATTALTDVVPRVVTTAGASRVVVAARAATRPPVVVLANRELAVRDVDVAGLVVRAWARARLRELSAPEEIAELGKRTTMLTPRTSLLVLESWWDYEMYDIELPEDVAAAKARAIAEKAAAPAPVPWQPAPVPQPQFQGPVGWFVKGSVVEPAGGALPGVTVTLVVDNVAAWSTTTDANGRFWLPAKSVPAKFTIRAELAGFGGVVRQFDAAPTGGDVQLTMKTASVAESITVTAEAPSFDENTVETTTLTRASVVGPADMQLAADVAHIGRELEHAPLERRHELVGQLVERIASLRSTAARMREYAMARAVAGGEKQLHLGAAEALRTDDPDLALRVLTDLAEAYGDDAPIVRIVARIADGWGRGDVARALLLHALEVSPREPQTWRELILIAAREGRGGELAALRKRHGAMVHDRRMNEVDEQIEIELARAAKGGDPRVDDGAALQVELMWDSNYSYVDIHVVEPSGEEVTWDHERSAHGGSLSGWLTEGFGPEIYVSRGGLRGTYRIDVQYFSSDESEVSRETLAHLVVLTHGRFGVKRTDHVVVLSRNDERRNVVNVNVE
jgi:Ca-activated chloride channel family protein